MKKIGLLLVVSVLAFTTLFAQDRPRDRKMPTPTERAEKMKTDFQLSDSQTKELVTLFQKQEDSRKANMEKMKSEKTANREEFAKQRNADDEALKKIIGDENFSKLKEQRASRGERNKSK